MQSLPQPTHELPSPEGTLRLAPYRRRAKAELNRAVEAYQEVFLQIGSRPFRIVRRDASHPSECRPNELWYEQAAHLRMVRASIGVQPTPPLATVWHLNIVRSGWQ